MKIPKFRVINKRTGKEADPYKLARRAEWAKHLSYCDMDGFAIMQDGTLVLCDDFGQMAYCPEGRFEVVFESEGET